jgi:hypothetical protein
MTLDASRRQQLVCLLVCTENLPAMNSFARKTSRVMLPGLFAGLVLTACYVPAPAPPSTYDRAFHAVEGALIDQGVRITQSNPGSGTVTGVRGNITLTASVTPRPDGTTQVEFRTSGNTNEDPTLINRITAAYNARMGR